MNIVVAVRDRLTGSVVSALELAEELQRRGHRVFVDEGDYDQAWDDADVALVHPDHTRIYHLSRIYRVPLVLLARDRVDVETTDPTRFRLVVKASATGFRAATPLPEIRMPPLVPLATWRVCPHRDPDCSCPQTAVCRYEHDPQTGRAPQGAPAPPSAVVLVGASARHGASFFYDVARRNPGREFIAVRSGRGDVAPPPLVNLDLVGPVEPRGLRRVYARARIVLMPSPQTAGRPALEAGATGIPTIAHPSPGALETLNGAVTWASSERPRDWQRAIDALDDPVVYQRAAQDAYRLAASTSRARHVDRLVSALEAIA